MININGNEEEVETARNIINNITDLDCLIKLSVLAEEIRTRELTSMKWSCCAQCNKYNTCRIKWHRGENKDPDICCSYCQNYKDCLEKYRKQASNETKVIENIFIINIYGDEKEIKKVNSLVSKTGSPHFQTKLAALANTVKAREAAKFI